MCDGEPKCTILSRTLSCISTDIELQTLLEETSSEVESDDAVSNASVSSSSSHQHPTQREHDPHGKIYIFSRAKATSIVSMCLSVTCNPE